jgi:predicted DNA-binding protein (UPF0251 family)
MKDKKITYKERIVSEFGKLSVDEKIDLLSQLVSTLKGKASDKVPASIFDNKKLSIFEALVKYMHENMKMRFVKIAMLLSRSDKTIWTTYSKAKKKMPSGFASLSSDINIPIGEFSNKNLTIFESVVYYLKKNDMTNHEAAVMLNRDDRTIWSVYDRAKKKRK